MITGLVAGGFSLIAFVVTMIFLPESLTKREEAISQEQISRRKLIDFAALKKVFSEPSEQYL